MAAPKDRIDELTAQWRDVRPDLDVTAMHEAGRLVRIGQLITERHAAAAAAMGLDLGQGDVLFTLRRAGRPLSPTDLADRTLVTTGTMTNRLDKLERRGLVRRVPNPDDRRGLVIELTDGAVALVDEALEAHVTRLEEIMGGLSRHERGQLVTLTRKLLAHLS